MKRDVTDRGTPTSYRDVRVEHNPLHAHDSVGTFRLARRAALNGRRYRPRSRPFNHERAQRRLSVSEDGDHGGRTGRGRRADRGGWGRRRCGVSSAVAGRTSTASIVETSKGRRPTGDDLAAAAGDEAFEAARDGGENGVAGAGAGVGVDEDGEQFQSRGRSGAGGAGAVGVDELVEGLRLPDHHAGQVLHAFGELSQLVVNVCHLLRVAPPRTLPLGVLRC